MPRYGVNFPLILLLMLLLLPKLFGVVFAVDPRGSSGAAQLCNFDEDNGNYNATDLLLCMNEQARDILFQRSTNPNRITDRAYQDTRQSYPAYPFAPAYSIPPPAAGAPAAPSNYFGNEMLSQLLSGNFQLPSFSNLLDFSSLTKPGFKFFNALSSIAQYDDLKCVPRILCEVASGSMPGSLGYRQSSGFENFGSNIFSSNNPLFGLLTAFDTSGTSPILSFGRAALLGYTNRGQPHMCYREYSRCPRDSGQLISYLNNHNGGFFRFFNGNGGAYYPQQHYGYRPQNYYKNSAESENRIIQKPQYPTTQIFSEADVDEGGSGVFQFGNSDYHHLESNKPEFFSMRVRESGSGGFAFPKDKRDDQYVPNYFNRPFDSSNVFETYNFQRESIRKDRKLFSAASDNYKDHPSSSNQIDGNRQPQLDKLESKVNYVRFPRQAVEILEGPLFFPNNVKHQYRDY